MTSHDANVEHSPVAAWHAPADTSSQPVALFTSKHANVSSSSQMPYGTQPGELSGQSASVMQNVKSNVTSGEGAHAVCKHKPPSAAWHSESVRHVIGTSGLPSGKYCKPTPRPSEAGSPANAISALRTASHLVVPSLVRPSIEPE